MNRTSWVPFCRTVRLALVGLILLGFTSLPASSQEDVEVQGGRVLKSFSWISVTWDDNALRLRMDGVDVDGYVAFELAGPPRIVIDIPSRRTSGDETVHEFFDFEGIPLLDQLRASASGEGTRVVLESRYSLYWEAAHDSERARLEITCLLRFRQAVEEVSLEEGTRYICRRYVTPSGQRFVHAIILDSASSVLEPRVVLASDVTPRRLAPLEDIVVGCGAAAGINGGFYAWPGLSLSLVIQDGEITAPPQLRRPSFIVLEDGSYHINYLPIRGSVRSAYGVLWIADAVNQAPALGQTALLTPGHPSRIREEMPGMKAVILDGVVEYITSGEIEDFSNRHILWSRDRYPPLALLSAGERVEISLYVDPSIPPIQQALQGGPLLLESGRICITAEQDDISRDIVRGRSARTGVGVDGKERVYLVVIEGPGGNRSIGATLEELAWTLLDLGAETAMNLDGGSSTGMALGFVSPDSGLPSGARSIATALVLIDPTGRMQEEHFFF